MKQSKNKRKDAKKQRRALMKRTTANKAIVWLHKARVVTFSILAFWFLADYSLAYQAKRQCFKEPRNTDELFLNLYHYCKKTPYEVSRD